MGWEAKLAWPVEHVVGCCFVLSSPLWAPSESRVARSQNTGPAPRRRELQCGVPPSGAWSRHRPRAPGNWSPRSSSAERGGAWLPAPTPSRSCREQGTSPLPAEYIRRSYCRRSDASLRLGEQGNFPTPVVPGARLRPDSVPQRDFKLSSAGQCPCQGERYRLGLPSPGAGLRPPARLHAEFRGPMPVPGERYRLDFRPPARPQAEFRW